MKPSCNVPHIHEVSMNTPCFNESTLCVGDKGVHVRAKMDSKDLCNDFGNCMDEDKHHPSWGYAQYLGS